VVAAAAAAVAAAAADDGGCSGFGSGLALTLLGMLLV